MSDLRCVIVVAGELDRRFGDAFADLSVGAAAGNTILAGDLLDQSQLQGVIRQLFDLGLDLVTLSAIPLSAPIGTVNRPGDPSVG